MKKILLIIIGLFICSMKVDAISFKVDDWVPNSYIVKIKNGKRSYLQMQYIYDQDGTITYCMQPFELIDTSGRNYIAYITDYEEKSGLSKESWNRVMLLAYYGYNYESHTESKWYAITQFLIWKTVEPTATIYFTDKLNGNEVSKFESEIKELNNLVDKHSITPSFDNKYIVNYKDSLIISDNNEVLSNFSYRDNDDFIIKKSGNSLNIVANKPVNSSEIVFEKKDDKYSKPIVIYIDNSNQNTVAVGSYTPVISKILVEVTFGKIVLDIRNDNSLYSAQAKFLVEYGIYDNANNLLEKIVYDKPGIYTSDILPYGTYTIRQISTGEGYIPDDKSHIIALNSKEESVILDNDIINNTVEISKYYGNPYTQDYELEKNATFEVLDIDKNQVSIMKTNDDGHASLKLGYGKYYLNQISGIENYEFIDIQNIEVINDLETQIFEYYNYLKPVQTMIRFVDEEGNIIDKDLTILLNSEKYQTISGTILLNLLYGEYSLSIGKLNDYIIDDLYKFNLSELTPTIQADGDEYYLIEIVLPKIKKKKTDEIEKVKSENNEENIKQVSKDQRVDNINIIGDENNLVSYEQMINPNTGMPNYKRWSIIILLISLFGLLLELIWLKSDEL